MQRFGFEPSTRSAAPVASPPLMWRVGDCIVDAAAQVVRRGGQIVPLRPMAWALLWALLQRPNALVATDALCAACWPGQPVSGKRLGNLASDLRSALAGPSGGSPPLLAVPRRGYLLQALPLPATASPALPPAVAAPSPATAIEPAGFVGRARALRALLDGVRHPGAATRACLVVAEAGLGKSALLDACLARLEPAGGWTVLRANLAPPIGAPVPLGAWLDMLRCQAVQGRRVPEPDHAADLAPAWRAMVPLLFGRTPADLAGLPTAMVDEATMLQQGVDLISHWSLASPLIVVLDDLHWCDDASLALLQAVQRRALSGRLQLWMATRPPAMGASAALDALMLEADLEVVPLHPLDEPDVAHFLAHRLGSWDTARALAAKVHATTGGVPLLLDLLARAIVDEGEPCGQHDLVYRAAGSGLATLVHQRLSRLHADAQSLVEALAATAGEAPLGLLTRALGLTDEVGECALEPLLARGLCRRRALPELSGALALGPVVGFSHALYGEVIWHGLPPERQLARGMQLVQAIEALPDLAAHPVWGPQVAFVYATAGRHVEAARCLRTLHAAGQNRFSAAAAKSALLGVLDLLQRAGDSDPVLALKLEVLHDLFECSAIHRGNAGAAAQAYLDQIQALAARSTTPRARFLACHAACTAAWRGGRADLAAAHLTHLAAVAAELGAVERATVRLVEGGVLRSLGRLGPADAALRALLASSSPDAEREPLAGLRLSASIAHHRNQSVQGDPVAGLEGLSQAAEDAFRRGRPFQRLAALFWTGSALRLLGCAEAAQPYLREVQALGSSLQTPYLQDECRVALMACREPARRDVALLEHLVRPGPSAIATWGHKVGARLLAEARLARGELGAARALADATRADLQEFPLYAPEVHRLDGDIAWAEARIEAALGHWTQALRSARAQGHEAAALQVAFRGLMHGLEARAFGVGTLQLALAGLLAVPAWPPLLSELGRHQERLRRWLRA